MKKVVAVLIAVALLLSCMTVTVFAKEQNSKFTAALAEKLESLPEGEKIETCIWLFYQHDAELIERMTFEECGLTAGTCMTLEEVDIYSKTYNRIAGELEAAGNKALIEKAGIPDKDVLFCGTMSPMVVLNLTNEQVYAIADYEEVQILDYDTTVLSDETADYSELYQSRFEEQYVYDDVPDGLELMYYREYFYHYDDNGEIDWALVGCRVNLENPATYSTIIGNRVLLHDNQYIPFTSGYALYDVNNDEFIPAESAAKYYDGFTEAFDECITEGRLLGDIDSDSDISIIDVTILQRCDAEIITWSDNDTIDYSDPWNDHDQVYYSDFNRDGDRDILDATCIQRYLAGMDYPIG